jgi:hypothetical protein
MVVQWPARLLIQLKSTQKAASSAAGQPPTGPLFIDSAASLRSSFGTVSTSSFRPSSLIGVLWLCLWAGCSSSKFGVNDQGLVDAAAGGTSAGNAGSAGGGAAGSAGSDASTDGSAASGGSAGTLNCPGGCDAAQYCNVSSGKCTPCSDVSRFRFAPAEPIAPRGPGASNQRFPRLTGQPSEMLFRVGDEAHTQALYVTSNLEVSGSEQPFGQEINLSSESTSGPLEARIDSGDFPNFFFDRTTAGPTSPRVLYGVKRGMGVGLSGSIAPMPAPFNSMAGSTASNYSIAIAGQLGRAFWMSLRGGSPDLLTALLEQASAPTPVSIRLGASTCTRSGLDSTPWVSSDGKFLLFSSLEVNSNCASIGSARDLHVAAMQGGQPAGFAIALEDVNQAGVDDADPSMSSDLCHLYFASNPSGTPDGFRLYRALRH